MKKILGVFLVLAMMVSLMAGSIAESTEFSVRGGITFDSTKEDILAYEKTQGGKINEKPDVEYYYTSNCIKVDDIKFAGYDDVQVVYYFDDNDKLSSILYMFHQYVDDKASGDKLYGIIDDGLAKYGTPIATGNEFLDINNAFDVLDYCGNDVFLGITAGATTSPISFAQRLFQLDNGYVDIKDIEFLWNYTMNIGGYKMKSNQYYVAVSYSFCSEEDIQAVNDKIVEKQNAINNDL